MRIGAAVLGFVSACSFEHGALSPQDDARDIDGAIDSRTPDARPIDARPDSPPPAPVTMTFPATQDTYVDSTQASSNFGGAANMITDGGGTPATAMMRMDLSSIPTGATVQSAVLHIWVSNDTGDPVNIYQMLEGWDEATATWNQRGTGMAWAGAGASPPSRATTVLATYTPDANYAEKTSAIANTVVQGWVTNPATNFGFAIVSTNSDGSAWRTRENTTVENHPILVVTYVPPAQ